LKREEKKKVSNCLKDFSSISSLFSLSKLPPFPKNGISPYLDIIFSILRKE
jgi:hypothetical protein